ncbi:MAG: HlyC/CorC family transporter [Sandaracinaceae bacterium]|nr:HlyC/CorC family transporter [Sandaracinaceae bacterium]
MLKLLVAVLCVAANSFFVAAEFAMAKVRSTSLEAMAKAGDKPAVRALAIQKQLDVYLTTTQLGITLSSLCLGWVGEPAVAALIEPAIHALGASDAVVHGIAIPVGFAGITLVHIVIGELVPKSFAMRLPEPVARATARPLQIIYFILYPGLFVLNGISRAVLTLLRLPAPDNAEGVLSLEELRLIVKASFKDSTDKLEAKKGELLERVLRGTDRNLRSVMVPRVDMITLALDMSFEEALAHVRRHGFSRYPLSETGDPDKVLGYIYVKDVLMATEPPKGGLRALKRDILYVPESRTVGDTLTEFQRTKIPIAVVVDEYGGTSGIVTLENLVEEIVGDIQDELDVEGPRIDRRDDGVVVVDGSMGIDQLEIPGLEIPALEGGETVGGFVIASLGRLAHPGDRVRLGGYDAVVEDVRRRRVGRVAFVPAVRTIPPPPAAPTTEEPSA